MKQQAEIVTTDGGTKIRFQQSQKEFALSRDDVMFLTQVPERFLLDEMRSRGYDLSGATCTLFGETIRLDAVLDAVLDSFCIGAGRSLDDLFPAVIDRAVRRFRSQKKAAEVLGVSSRKVCYWYTTRNKAAVDPAIRLLTDGRRRRELVDLADDAIDAVDPENHTIVAMPSHEVEDDWDW